MDKLLVTLKVPSLRETFDLFVPDFLQVKTLIPLFAEALGDLSQHRYVTSDTEILCRREPDLILDPELTLKEHGVRNGDCLYLF